MYTEGTKVLFLWGWTEPGQPAMSCQNGNFAGISKQFFFFFYNMKKLNLGKRPSREFIEFPITENIQDLANRALDNLK